MESQQLINLLYERNNVSNDLNELMVELLASHRLSGKYKSDTPEIDALSLLYYELTQLMQELQIDFHERLHAEGIQGNLKNYKITGGIARLKLHLDIMSRIFNSQNIDTAYKQELVRAFEVHKQDIEVYKQTGEQSLIQKLLYFKG